MRRTTTGVAALLAATPLLAACGSGPGAPTDPAAGRPKTEVALPADKEAWNATSPYPTSTVTLAVGQRFSVAGNKGPQQGAWIQTSAGDGAVLRPGPDVVTTPCPEDSLGCVEGVDHIYTALAPGTTTLTWEFHDRSKCHDAPTQPVVGCSDITKSIQVTVR
jgi:hypothetical protein